MGRADHRKLLLELEEGKISPADALAALASAAHDAATTEERLSACTALGSLAGRELGTPWDVAERAAFALLQIAREADAQAERVGMLEAMGRAYRNVWLVPYVHSRLSDDDDSVVAAAISAAGGLAFPALESTIAGLLNKDSDAGAQTRGHSRVRLVAIAALGRMGAESAAAHLVPFVAAGAPEASHALSALTEIRSRVGEKAALDLLATDPPRDVMVAAVRYLAEIGQPEVLRALRRLARDSDPENRIVAGLASRAFKAEKKADPDERILTALTERDRAVRGALARRLRTLPVADVLAQAELLVADDPEGIVQVIAEVRAPEVTRLLLKIATDATHPVSVRARAAGAIEADEPWERDALVELCGPPHDSEVRETAARTIGAFAPPSYVLDRLAPMWDAAAPGLRGALLWALQFTTRPGKLDGKDRDRAEAWVKRALADADPLVRRRAAYVAGNLDAAALVPDLVELARRETDRADLRVAAFVALSEVASPARFADLVHLWNREDDADALGAASRAIERSLLSQRAQQSSSASDGSEPSSQSPSQAPPSLARVNDRLPKLLASPDARVRAAAARVAGLTKSDACKPALVALAEDEAPRVREQAIIALGRCGGPEPTLASALSDVDLAISERAAEALLAVGTSSAIARVVDFISRAEDRAAAARIVARIDLPRPPGEAIDSALAGALSRTPHGDPAYEALLGLKIAALESAGATPSARGPDVDAEISQRFSAWPRLSQVRGFQPLGKSLRTAEMLHRQSDRSGDTDLSAAIVLWMKCLEGYMHAWLGPRMRALSESPSALNDVADRLLGSAWPSYQRFVQPMWADPVKVGALSVEVPLRSMPNALRDIQERRHKSLDSPPSVTEWARLMLFLAIDHATGTKNVLKVSCNDANKMVRLVHSLSVLAQVRNTVTHRAAAGADTVNAFRVSYYAAFDELCTIA
jgi:HEAT repeat protein